MEPVRQLRTSPSVSPLQPPLISAQEKMFLPQTTFACLFENNIPLCRTAILGCEAIRSFEPIEKDISSFIDKFKDKEQPTLLIFKSLVDALTNILASDDEKKRGFTFYGVQQCLEKILIMVDVQDMVLLFNICLNKEYVYDPREYSSTIVNILNKLDIKQLSDSGVYIDVFRKLSIQYSTNFPPAKTIINNNIIMSTLVKDPQINRCHENSIKLDSFGDSYSGGETKSIEEQEIVMTDTTRVFGISRSLAGKYDSPIIIPASFSQNRNITTTATTTDVDKLKVVSSSTKTTNPKITFPVLKNNSLFISVYLTKKILMEHAEIKNIYEANKQSICNKVFDEFAEELGALSKDQQQKFMRLINVLVCIFHRKGYKQINITYYGVTLRLYQIFGPIKKSVVNTILAICLSNPKKPLFGKYNFIQYMMQKLGVADINNIKNYPILSAKKIIEMESQYVFNTLEILKSQDTERFLQCKM